MLQAKKLQIKDKWVGDVINILLENLDVHRATKYISPTLVMTATAISYKREKERGKRDARVTRHEISLKVGSPNYKERKNIRLLKKAKVAFPINKIKLTRFRKIKKN